MKPTYRIRDWEKHFENHDSKRIANARWFPMPNKHDGKSYRRVALHPDNCAVFTGWTLILEVASKMPVRGVLADEDGPLDADDLAAMTSFPPEVFQLAFAVLTQERIGWLDRLDAGESRLAAKESDAPRNIALELHNIELHNKEEQESTTARKKPRAEGGRGSRIPEDFEANDSIRLWAKDNAPDVDVSAALEEFKDFWRGLPGFRGLKLDWNATFRNRLRDLQGKGGNGYARPNGTNKSTGYQTAAERRDEGVKRQIALVQKLRSGSN